jgi:hypothetical protein
LEKFKRSSPKPNIMKRRTPEVVNSSRQTHSIKSTYTEQPTQRIFQSTTTSPKKPKSIIDKLIEMFS